MHRPHRLRQELQIRSRLFDRHLVQRRRVVRILRQARLVGLRMVNQIRLLVILRRHQLLNRRRRPLHLLHPVRVRHRRLFLWLHRGF